MKFFIKPQTDKEAEIWDSGWRCGTLFGLLICALAMIICGIIIFNK